MPVTGTQRRRRREGGKEIKFLKKNIVSLLARSPAYTSRTVTGRDSEFVVIIVVRLNQDRACDDVAKLFH